MRVLRVIHDLNTGGVQRQMLRALRTLRDLGVQSEVACVDGRGPMVPEFEAEGFPVHVIRFRSRLDPIGLVQLATLVVRGRFDLVHAHMYQAIVSATAAMYPLRGRALLHGYHSTNPAKTPKHERRLREFGARAHGHVAVSRAVAEVLHGYGFPIDRIHVLYNGIDVPVTRWPRPDRAPGGPLELVWAGRFVDQKRLPFLVDVLVRLREQGTPARLTLLGDGPEMGHLRQMRSSLDLGDALELPGFVNDVPRRIAQADLYIVASEREGFSNSLLETCSVGRGMVLSDIAPHRELLGPTDAGRVLPLRVEDWVAVLRAIAADPARIDAMGEAAFALAQDFRLPVTCRRMLDVYEASVARARA